MRRGGWGKERRWGAGGGGGSRAPLRQAQGCGGWGWGGCGRVGTHACLSGNAAGRRFVACVYMNGLGMKVTQERVGVWGVVFSGGGWGWGRREGGVDWGREGGSNCTPVTQFSDAVDWPFPHRLCLGVLTAAKDVRDTFWGDATPVSSLLCQWKNGLAGSDRFGPRTVQQSKPARTRR